MSYRCRKVGKFQVVGCNNHQLISIQISMPLLNRSMIKFPCKVYLESILLLIEVRWTYDFRSNAGKEFTEWIMRQTLNKEGWVSNPSVSLRTGDETPFSKLQTVFSSLVTYRSSTWHREQRTVTKPSAKWTVRSCCDAYLGKCPPTPPLTQQQSIDNKLGLMLG